MNNISMKKLILIDGYSFLFRAFFAIRNLTRKERLNKIKHGIYKK